MLACGNCGIFWHMMDGCLFICEKVKVKKKEGILADIAPTILDLMNLEKPSNMNGCSLLI